ncbi:hypothetical protein BDV06DRAFT_234506 [Aspergillus oleicola]
MSLLASTRKKRRWTKGVLVCAWIVATVLALNIILTITSAILAATKYNGGSFARAPVYQGSCSTAKNAAAVSHLFINVLSTIMLGASNYAMQCLAAPSRLEVDEAHEGKNWLNIGTPDIPALIISGRGRRRFLGILLFITSFPIHLIYNSAVYYSMQTNRYPVIMASANTSLEEVYPPQDDDDFERCFKPSFNMSMPEFRTAMREKQYKTLSKQECVDTFAQDFVFGQKGVILITNATLTNDDAPLVIVGEGNTIGFGNSLQCSFAWMCPSFMCNEKAFKDQYMDNWMLSGARLTVPELDVSVPTAYGYEDPYPIDHCLVLQRDETCQLVFSPVICLIVICCNAIKLICIVSTTRDDRDELLLTIGDALSSFLIRPDPTTKGFCLLSKILAEKGAQGWMKKGKNKIKEYEAASSNDDCQFLPAEKRWVQSVSYKRWIGTLYLCLCILAASGVALHFAMTAYLDVYGTGNIWESGLGEPSTANVLDSVYIGVDEGPIWSQILRTILLANTPQLIVSMVYYFYNSLLTSMLLASEYNSYATEKKPLRVSWPSGAQRSTYYLSIPYRYGMTLLVASALLHWMISQSFFYVEIVTFDVSGEYPHMTVSCGYSPAAIIPAIILGSLLVLGGVVLGMRRFKSRMPLAVHCSAAISAACHPPSGSGTVDHALKPVQWGEPSRLPRPKPESAVRPK